METSEVTTITVEAVIKASVERVWECWTKPEHIVNWCYANDDWHAPHAENDLRIEGKFKTMMAAKDGSFSFGFSGVYTNVEQHKAIDYTLDDGRKVKIRFHHLDNETQVVESFEAENTHSIEMQKQGWHAILENFRRYTEAV
jgi:uncharacterized protein YndB with AHSA1/START domain